MLCGPFLKFLVKVFTNQQSEIYWCKKLKIVITLNTTNLLLLFFLPFEQNLLKGTHEFHNYSTFSKKYK